MKWTRLLGMAVIFAGLAAAFALWGHRTWLPKLVQWLDVGQPYHEVDTVMALPGDLEHRPFVAAALINTGLAERAIVITSAPTAESMDDIAEPQHVLTQKIYEARGVPSDRVVLMQGRSTATIQDIAQLMVYLRRHPQRSIGVVTNAYHTRRTR